MAVTYCTTCHRKVVGGLVGTYATNGEVTVLLDGSTCRVCLRGLGFAPTQGGQHG